MNNSSLSLAIILPPLPFTPKNKMMSMVAKLGGNGAPLLFSASLSSYIKKRDPSAEITILDGCVLNLDQVFSRLKAKPPSVVGISPSLVSYENALKIARFAKNLGSLVILGGNYATTLGREILLNRGPCSNDYCIDAVVVQDGEEALWQIVSQKPFSEISNLVYRSQEGIILNNVKSPNLNYLPIPDFSLSQEKESSDRNRFFLIFSRKGCSWRQKKGACLFCSLMHKDFRCKSASHFYKEVDALINKYQPEFIFDVSDNFLDDPAWFSDFHHLYKNYPSKPKIQCYSRVDDFTPDNIDKLLDINVGRIIFGVESNDDSILNTFGKGYSEQKNREAVKSLDSSGIFARINFVIGGIGENQESLLKTLNFAKWAKKILKDRVMFFVSLLSPFPGSRAFAILNEKTGRKYSNYDLMNLRQLREDWFRYFCNISLNSAYKFVIEMDSLNGDYQHEKFEEYWR